MIGHELAASTMFGIPRDLYFCSCRTHTNINVHLSLKSIRRRLSWVNTGWEDRRGRESVLLVVIIVSSTETFIVFTFFLSFTKVENVSRYVVLFHGSLMMNVP